MKLFAILKKNEVNKILVLFLSIEFKAKKKTGNPAFIIGRGSQTRTDTGVNPQDFESSASTSSAIPPSDIGIDNIFLSSRQ